MWDMAHGDVCNSGYIRPETETQKERAGSVVEAEKKKSRVREFQTCRVLMKEELTAKVLVFEAGAEVSIYGGSLPHIGAVSIVGPDGNMTTTQFPGHRDGVVAARWAETIAHEGFLPVTVVAGIHYDNLTKKEIEAVVAATDEMLKEALEKIKAKA